MKNIEIKFRIVSFNELYAFVQKLPEVKNLQALRQTDTYFQVPRGRLKLRQHDSGQAQLIYYERNDITRARESTYQIYQTHNADLLHHLLETSLGIDVTVRKERQLLMFRNVRLHLDRVDKLGEFLELESVIDETTDSHTARKNLNEIRRKLKSFDLIPVAESYSDLLRERNPL